MKRLFNTLLVIGFVVINTCCYAQTGNHAQVNTLGGDPPTILSFSPTSGCRLVDTVVINGTWFTNVVMGSVKIGGISVSSYTVNSNSKITAIVGAGTTGPISVKNQYGTGTSAAIFTVDSLLAAPDTVSGPLTVCAGSTNTYAAALVTGATSYSWSFPAGWMGNPISIMGDSISVVADSVLSTGTFTVTANNTCGAGAQQTIDVYASTPSSQIITPQVTSCPGDMITLSATNDNANIINYTWIDGMDTICSSISCAATPAAPWDTTTYQLIVTDVNGCTKEYFYTANVFPAPDTTLTLSGSVISSNQMGATYKWIDCKTNTAIGGETNQSYTVTVDGNYAVVVTKNGCSDTSACVNVIVTGVAQLAVGNSQFAIFPNPNNGTFQLTTNNNEPTTISITNSLGEIVYSGYISNPQSAIINSQLSNGIYFIELTSNNTTSRQKIIISK